MASLSDPQQAQRFRRETALFYLNSEHPVLDEPRAKSSGVAGRIRCARALEALAPQAARLATAAGASVVRRLVTRDRQGIVEAERHPAADDLRFAERDDRGVQPQRPPLDRRFGREIRKRFFRAFVFFF